MKLSLILKCPSYRCLLLEEKYLHFANSNLFALHFYTQKYVINRRFLMNRWQKKDTKTNDSNTNLTRITN